MLQRALAAVEGPVVLMKGPEVAEYYENSLTRPYRDIDLLVEDADEAWHAMVGAGFEPTGDPELYIGIHHLRPLVVPGLPLVVEVHHQPKWLEGAPPPTAELLRTAVPSATGIPGLLTLEPARHAVVLAVHAWAHVPLSRLGRLDRRRGGRTGSRSQRAPRRRGRLERRAECGARRRAHDRRALRRGGRRPLGRAQLWTRHLWRVRERTVIERHLQRWLAPFSGAAASPGRAVRLLGGNVGEQCSAGRQERRDAR